MTSTKTMTTQEVADRFHELAQQEKWFEIQDEFFADNVRSVEPPDSPYFPYAEGKMRVRKKGEEFVGRITELHSVSTTAPIAAGPASVTACAAAPRICLTITWNGIRRRS